MTQGNTDTCSGGFDQESSTPQEHESKGHIFTTTNYGAHRMVF